MVDDSSQIVMQAQQSVQGGNPRMQSPDTRGRVSGSPVGGSAHKELGPVGRVEAVKPVEVVASHPEVKVPQELEKVVEKSPEVGEFQIDKEMAQAGVAHAPSATPVVTTPTGKVSLPMTYAEAKKVEKTTSFWSSLHWLARLIEYQWEKLAPEETKG